MVRGFLVLENGTVLEGVSFGHDSTVLGEMVFTTCMSGYQESITDPAYKGQILVSAFPLIGDYGVNERFSSSDAVHASGLVVREYSAEPSDMYGGRTLGDYLKEHKIPAISGIDTRELVRTIRSGGTMKAAIAVSEKDVAKVKRDLTAKEKEKNLVASVSPKKIIKKDNKKGVTVGILDCGADRGLVNDLSERYDVVSFPYDTEPETIREHRIKALIVSNGPGNPAHPDLMNTVVKTIKELSGSVPMIGISFGAQCIALAFGCRTVKMTFGHHGCNQPVRYGKRVHITSQNRMYDIDRKSLKGTGLVEDQTNVNDGTLEGFSHEKLPVTGMQYYPVSPKYEDDSFFYVALEKMTGVKK